MALVRLVSRNLYQRVSSSSSLVGRGVAERQSWNKELFLKRFMVAGADKVAGETSDGKQVAVSEDGDKKKGKRGIWRRNGQEFVPQLYEFFPSGLGNALLQASENLNKLFHNLKLTPANLIGRFKENEQCYKLRYEVAGLSKEDLKLTIDDGVLTIKGEHKEEKEEEDEDEYYWSRKSYGYYNTSVLLPDDAKVDEIKAELKNGVLHIAVPRTQQPKKDLKEVPIH